MLYVLEFEKHSFKTCETIKDAIDYIATLSPDQIENVIIINRMVDSVEMDMDTFEEFCENFSNE